MLYSIASEFVKINETHGTIQNTSSVYTVEVSDKAEIDSGFLLMPLNKMSFDGEVYLRCAEGGGRALIRVVSFLVNSGGVASESSVTVDDSLVITDEELDTLLDEAFNGDGTSSVPADPEIDQLLDDIFG